MSVIQQQFSQLCDRIILTATGFEQRVITYKLSTINAKSEIKDFSKKIISDGQSIIMAFVAGTPEMLKGLKSEDFKFPILFLTGDKCNNCDCLLGGVQFLTMAGLELHPVYFKNKLIGNWYEDDNAKYCYLANITAETEGSYCDKTIATFENIESVLQTVGMNFKNVARTWCYLRQLLTWYDDFNKGRTHFFNKYGIFDNFVPASTGIGACLPDKNDIVIGTLAIAPKNEKVTIEEIISPLQCPANDYRSAFSRAVEIKTPDYKQLLVSGTASIEPNGKTVFIDDIYNQVKLTFEVIKAMLDQQGYIFEDCSRAIAYYKDPSFITAWRKYWQDMNYGKIPIVHFHADVCRGDLLYEIEMDFLQPTM